MQGIYKLSFNNTRRVYVGKSTYMPARYSKHISTLVKGTHHNSGMQEYYNNTKELPTIEILEEVSEANLLDTREIFWITKLD